MNKRKQSIDKEILDLQVFITRYPSQKATKYKGLPSYFISSEGFRNLTREQSSTNVPNQVDETSIVHKYVAIANSSAVAEIALPFGVDEIIAVIKRLDAGRIKLVDCMDFGVKLFNFIFQGSIRDLFRELSSQDKILRLTISTPIPELAVLPWELMCDIKSGFAPQFLCFQPQIRFCRALHLFDRSKFQARKQLGNGKVKLLLVTANPILTNYLDVGTEERLIQFVIDEAPKLENIELDILHNASVNSLREKLLKFRPHILHFSGHGGYRDDEDLGYIVLADKNNPQQPEEVNSYRFSAIIQEAGSVQLAFLSTCRGSAGDDKSAFSGVAQLLHANGVNGVAALSFAVQDRTGHAILANFYRYLLRYGLTVEESIARVRKLLFINGYAHSESFGLTLYQGNLSLYHTATENIEELETYFSEGKDFDKAVEDFESRISSEKVANMKLADLLRLKEIEEALQELAPTPQEVFLTIKVFGEVEVGFEALREIGKFGIDRVLFLEVCEIAKRLSHEANEGKLFPTAFVLDRKVSSKKNNSKKKSKEGENSGYKVAQKLHKDFFREQIKEVIRNASNVNGSHRTFVIQFESDGENYDAFVADINDVALENTDQDIGFGNPKWDRICHLVKNSGIALVVTGDERVKLIISGQQIAEYRSGVWRRANLKEFTLAVIEFSKKCSLDESLLLNILSKCMFASEYRKGLTFLIQNEVDLIEKCHNFRQDFADLSDRKISEFKSPEYIERVKGLDNAIILTKDGYTLAVSALPEFSKETQVEAIPGTGSRHLSAQKITKETDAIAFVVSEDRPITIFYNGQIEFRTE